MEVGGLEMKAEARQRNPVYQQFEALKLKPKDTIRYIFQQKR